MGAWGGRAFENDSALDWLSGLEAEGVAGLHRILSSVASTGPGDFVDADDGSAAIAAAEIVAATLSHGRDRLTTEAQKARLWASRDPAEIQRWLARAVDAPSVAALLDE
jgi:Domain of unknown function (DUF4259)